MPTPIRYTPSVEQPQPDEAKTIAGLSETIGEIQAITVKDGAPLRGVHAKGHGLLRVEVTILDGLPPELAQGPFATPGKHDGMMRFSTAPGDLLPDDVSSPRGLAIKILDVEGERLPDSPAEDGQDFLMVNGPAFGTPTPDKFLPGLKGLAKTTNKVEGLKSVISAVAQTIEGALEAVGTTSPMVALLGGAPNTHPLGDIYFTQVPSRYGDYIAKFSLAPVSPWLTDLKGDKVNAHDRPDALREDINEVIGTRGGTWELRVQLCTDLEKMPIEDASIAWDEKVSPFRTVARVEAAIQPSWEHGISEHEQAELAFSPWHGVTALQPLGGVNRARKSVYEKSQAFRQASHGCPMHARAEVI